MDTRSIAVFDSGLGGLPSLDKLTKLLPGEDYIYVADSGRMPYGDRSRGEITIMSRQLMSFVLEFDVKAILVACGTITSACLPVLQAMTPVPIFGVIESASRRAVSLSPVGRIGVIATTATISSGAYQKRIAQLRPEARVFPLACPRLAPLVESGHFSADDPMALEAVHEYADPLLSQGIDTLLLGCTHYALLEDALRSVCGDGVALVQNGGEAASAVAERILQSSLSCGRDSGGACRFFTTGDKSAFADRARLFLGRDISEKTAHISVFDL